MNGPQERTNSYGNIAEIFLDARERKKNCRSSHWQQIFLYPLLLRDDLYGMAYNRSVDDSCRERAISGLDDSFNFLVLKRLIKKLHQSEFSYITSNKFINKIQFVQEIILIISDLILSRRTLNSVKKTTRWSSYQSIHSVFTFIEDKVRSSSNYLDIVIPHSIHPEILTRIFRRHIPDISFLHSLRLLLHQNENSMILNLSHSGVNRFYRLLWNFYTSRVEYCLIYLWNRIHHLRPTSFVSLDETQFIKKIRYVSDQSDYLITESISKRNCSIHYVRYRNDLISIADESIESIENWKILFIITWEKYFHTWLEPYRISVRNLLNNPFSILGYILRTRNKLIRIRIKFLGHSIGTGSIIKGFCGVIPMIPSIVLLAEEGFCDVSGRPVCRVAWTTLTDGEILARFDRVIKNICYYYGGCCRKKSLYQLQYIFRFSCAKTLACKHKSTIRTVWKRYGSDLLTNSVSLKGMGSIPRNSWRREFDERRFWRLDITKTNFLTNSLQRLKNAQYFLF